MNDQNNSIRLYSYNKVWKSEKKVYALGNIILPVPVAIYDALYFVITLLVMLAIGNIIPITEHIPFVFRIAIPIGITKFLRKKKLDGKNPIKYLWSYLIYILIDKYSYIERFNLHPVRKKEEYKINWNCSYAYEKRKTCHSPIEVESDESSEIKEMELQEEVIFDNGAGEIEEVAILPAEEMVPDTVETMLAAEEPDQILIETAELEPEEPEVRSRKEFKELVRSISGKIPVKKGFHAIKSGSSHLLKEALKKTEVNAKIKKSEMNIPKPSVKPPKKERKHKLTQFDDMTIMVSVCSLDTGLGCSHIAKTLAYYIQNTLEKTVCIVDMKGERTGEIQGIKVYSPDQLYQAYEEFNYIIMDVGTYSTEVKMQIKQAQVKIMCARYDEGYLDSLASFVLEEKNSTKWKYLFNYVPSSKYKKVDEKMEDYSYYCLPTYHEDDKKELQKIVEFVFE